MASNHTEWSGITDALAVEYLWDHLSKEHQFYSKKAAVASCEIGFQSVSNILEQVIADNSSLKRSNKAGEDFDDGSDAKYMRARRIAHSNGYKRTWCTLSPASVRNKKGALRIFITQMDEILGITDYHMYVIPYEEWKSRMTSTGITFCFSSKHGCLTDASYNRWGRFKVDTIRELSQ